LRRVGFQPLVHRLAEAISAPSICVDCGAA
jgi:hypothetical protein